MFSMLRPPAPKCRFDPPALFSTPPLFPFPILPPAAYFANMINPAKRWLQVPNPPTANGRVNYQWVPSTPQPPATEAAAPSLLLLNTDLALYKDLGTPNVTAGGTVTCTYDTCPNAPTWAIVQQYALDEQRFLNDFARAYEKMLNVCGRRTDGSPIPCTALQPLVGGGAGDACDDKGKDKDKDGKGKDKDKDGKGKDKDKDKDKDGKGKEKGCKGKGGKGGVGIGIGVGIGVGDGIGVGVGVGAGYGRRHT